MTHAFTSAHIDEQIDDPIPPHIDWNTHSLSAAPANLQRRRPLAHPLHQHRPPKSRVNLHCFYASDIPPKTRLLSAPNFLRYPQENVLVRETRIWQWSGITPLRHAANAASRSRFLLRRVHIPPTPSDTGFPICVMFNSGPMY